MTKHEKKEINRLLHEYLRIRDGEFCLKCRQTERLQLSHIYPKGKYRKLEFDHENVKLLCMKCHLYWWHKNPIEAHEWLQTAIPEDRLSKLKIRANTVIKATLDYKVIKLELEQLIKKYDSVD